MKQKEKNQEIAAFIGHYAHWCAEVEKIRNTRGFNARLTDKNKKRQRALEVKYAYAQSGRYLYLYLLADRHGIFPVGSTVEELEQDHENWCDIERKFKSLYRDEFGAEVFA